jgi:uncharacterized protein with FMN-binding domain
MPKRGAAALTLTGLALALLLNFRTPSAPVTVGGGNARSNATGGSSATIAGGSNAGGTSSGASRSSGSSASSGSSTTNGSTANGAGTYDGSVVETRFGPVQVEITVADGKVTDVTALQLPSDDRRSASISSRAEPLLRSEALSAQSANIDGVSGATYTSSGYAESLQSALDAAGL